MKMLSFALLVSVSASVAQAETLTLSPTEITEWKAVQARVESRDIVPARARDRRGDPGTDDQRG
jgi:hypothetical protein